MTAIGKLVTAHLQQIYSNKSTAATDERVHIGWCIHVIDVGVRTMHGTIGRRQSALRFREDLSVRKGPQDGEVQLVA